MIIRKLNTITLIIAFAFAYLNSSSQTVLEANGPGDTYELINSVLAPGYNSVETPDCSHPEFGRHIAEVWDDELKQYVFEFYIHVSPDNDRCITFDRQRLEIKTYESSPAHLKGVTGESVTYKWKFKLPKGFQPSSSFTHLHQIKAVGGDDDMPIITLTARSGNPNKMELIHNNVTKVVTVPLSLFEDNWVEATEKIKIDPINGSYSLVIKKISDGVTILSYSNEKIMTIRADNSFIRPKWGIYRSLLAAASLRDEAMRFASFSIQEGPLTSSISKPVKIKPTLHVYPNPATKNLFFEYYLHQNESVTLALHSANGSISKTIFENEPQQYGNYTKELDISDLSDGFYFVRLSSSGSSEIKKVSIIK